jgi:hypothetical protein
MGEAYTFSEKPESEELYLLTGFRQWADAGSVSSGLPQYLATQARAEHFGTISTGGYYLFQVPGAHDLMRPLVRYVDGHPTILETQRNDFFYTGDSRTGLVIFLGDEPHMDVERYVAALLDAAAALGVKGILGVGGVYGELPYDKQRMVSCTYSLPTMRDRLEKLRVSFSDYQGGASIDSVVAKRAGDRGMEYTGLYAFVPAYDFAIEGQGSNNVRIENDYTAWLGLMRRINYLCSMKFDLLDLETKSNKLLELIREKVDELDTAAPELGIREYMARLSQDFHEEIFNPSEEYWEDEINRLLRRMGETDEPAGPAEE